MEEYNLNWLNCNRYGTNKLLIIRGFKLSLYQILPVGNVHRGFINLLMVSIKKNPFNYNEYFVRIFQLKGFF